MVDNIQLTSVTVNWVVPSVTEQQQYRVAYGLDPQLLNQMSSVVPGVSDITLTDQEYSVDISGLTMSTNYYFRILATFGDQTIMSELSSFRTLDQRKTIKLFPVQLFICTKIYFSPNWSTKCHGVH